MSDLTDQAVEAVAALVVACRDGELYEDYDASTALVGRADDALHVIERALAAASIPADPPAMKVVHRDVDAVVVEPADPPAYTYVTFDDLRAEVARLTDALTYIAQPTMVLPGGVDPEQWVRDGNGNDADIRLALATCIRTARAALAAADPETPQ